MSMSPAFERWHGKLPKNLQFTEEGEDEASRMELKESESVWQSSQALVARRHEQQIARGHMYRCSCDKALYYGETAQHEYKRHGGPKPCKHYYRYKDECLMCGVPWKENER